MKDRSWHDTDKHSRTGRLLGCCRLKARLEAVIITAAMAEAGKSAWCREHGIYPVELDQWRASATTALAAPEEARASPQATRQDKKRIKELERELLRNHHALARRSVLR